MNYKIAVTDINVSRKEQDILSTLTNWLPKQVLDIHTHFGLLKNVLRIDDKIKDTPMVDFLYCDYQTHQRFNSLLSGIQIIQAAFAFPFQGIDIISANKYILNLAQVYDNIIPFLTGLPENKKGIQYTISEIVSGRYYGLKCYAQRLEKKASKITDFFTENILEAVNFMNLPIVLHIPGELKESLSEILDLADKYAEIKFIIAHMGRAYMLSKEYPQLLEKIKQTHLDNIFFDTSFCMDFRVIKCALEIIGYEKILYGSDQPSNMIRGRVYKHPSRGVRIMTNQKYSWVNDDEWEYYKNQIGGLIYVELEMLLALKKVLDSLPSPEIAKQNVFFNNAAKLLKII